MYLGCSEVSCKPTRLIQPIQNGIDAKAKYKMGKNTLKSLPKYIDNATDLYQQCQINITTNFEKRLQCSLKEGAKNRRAEINVLSID